MDDEDGGGAVDNGGGDGGSKADAAAAADAAVAVAAGGKSELVCVETSSVSWPVARNLLTSGGSWRKMQMDLTER